MGRCGNRCCANVKVFDVEHTVVGGKVRIRRWVSSPPSNMNPIIPSSSLEQYEEEEEEGLGSFVLLSLLVFEESLGLIVGVSSLWVLETIG